MHVNHLGVFSYKCVGSIHHMTIKPIWQISLQNVRCSAITDTCSSIFRLVFDLYGFFNVWLSNNDICPKISVWCMCSLHRKVWTHVTHLPHQHIPLTETMRSLKCLTHKRWTCLSVCVCVNALVSDKYEKNEGVSLSFCLFYSLSHNF